MWTRFPSVYLGNCLRHARTKLPKLLHMPEDRQSHSAVSSYVDPKHTPQWWECASCPKNANTKEAKKQPTMTPKEGGEAVQEGGQTGDLCLS